MGRTYGYLHIYSDKKRSVSGFNEVVCVRTGYDLAICGRIQSEWWVNGVNHRGTPSVKERPESH